MDIEIYNNEINQIQLCFIWRKNNDIVDMLDAETTAVWKS